MFLAEWCGLFAVEGEEEEVEGQSVEDEELVFFQGAALVEVFYFFFCEGESASGGVCR